MTVIGAGKIKYFRHARDKKKPTGDSVPLAYRDRNDRLSQIGYSSYRKYLASDEWKNLRGSLLAAFPECLLCGGKACQVHHVSYDWHTLLGVGTAFLTALCRSCHESIEFDGPRKRTLAQANGELFSRAAKKDRGRVWLATLARQEQEDRKAAALAKRFPKRRPFRETVERSEQEPVDTRFTAAAVRPPSMATPLPDSRFKRKKKRRR